MNIAKLIFPMRKRTPLLSGINFKWQIHVTQFSRDGSDKSFVCDISQLVDTASAATFNEVNDIMSLDAGEEQPHQQLQVQLLWLMQYSLLADSLPPSENLEHSIKVTLRKRHKLKIWITYSCHYTPQSRSGSQRQTLSFLSFSSTPIFVTLTVNNYSNSIEV